MIPASTLARQQAITAHWQEEMAAAMTRPEELIATLGLDARLIEPARAAGAVFRLRVPRSFVRRMRHGDPHDPLLRQVLPIAEEQQQYAGFVSDPLGEQ